RSSQLRPVCGVCTPDRRRTRGAALRGHMWKGGGPIGSPPVCGVSVERDRREVDRWLETRGWAGDGRRLGWSPGRRDSVQCPGTVGGTRGELPGSLVLRAGGPGDVV